MKFTTACLLGGLLVSGNVSAEIVEASATHYVLRHEATSTLSADALWDRLVDPASWWHPEHTYSGNAANLSLDLKPGGLGSETWEGGAVSHGTVLLVVDGSTLQLNAPFGPLLAAGAHTIWTITVTPSDSGSTVVFDEVSSGPPSAALDKLAAAVDYVKSEAIARLTSAQ